MNWGLLHEQPASEQPLNRLLQYGAGALSYAELLQLVLGAGEDPLGYQLLAAFQTLSGLARASLTDLQTIAGIGLHRSARLQATFELSQRLARELPGDRPQVRGPGDIAGLFMPEMSLLEQEQLRVVLLDNKHRVMATPTVYQGSVHTNVIRIAELFRDAIRRNSVAIAVVHNHPSGEPTPSPEDAAVTRELVRAGQLLDIEVLDHIVIGDQRWVSLKERGLGFSS